MYSRTGTSGLQAGHARAAARVRQRVSALRRIAWLLDEAIPVPGTKIRVGLDSLIGLLPGVGDVATTLASLYVVYEAQRLGVPRRMLVKMLANSGLDLLIGAVPLLGDIADVGFKANTRNIRLLEQHLRRLEGGREW